jgi:beta-aspartyl-peptidase (threonine type)
MVKPCLILHGGAWDIPEAEHEAHMVGVGRAVEIGYASLVDGGSALDAVEAAVRSMESDPTFDAGKGAFLNADGEVELDAMIMEGDELRFGAVAAVQHILHPVTLARKVMESTKHCMLVGEGALRFARAMDMDTVSVEELLTDREMMRLMEIRRRKEFDEREVFENALDRYERKGTVGAVALDERGCIAAATSTGGTPNKMAGRVGDSPLIGCGTYADSRSSGASATGFGESIMKVVLAKRVCDGVGRGLVVQEAADEGISYLQARVDGLGGVIVLDGQGRMAFGHNTPRMAVAYIDQAGEKKVRI